MKHLSIRLLIKGGRHKRRDFLGDISHIRGGSPHPQKNSTVFRHIVKKTHHALKNFFY